MVIAFMATETSSSQVTLRWNSSTDTGGLGLAGYLVYRDGILVGTTTTTEFVDTTVAPNTSYCYTIVAYDAGGNDALASAEDCITTPPPPQGNPTAPGFYVDYSAGSDANPGTSAAAPWQHCPGDPAATAVAASTQLAPGNTVFFKGGVQYVLHSSGLLYGQVYGAGIALNWSGTAGNPITYCSTNAWGTGRAVFTDNYSANSIVAFGNSGTVSNLVFNNLEFGPIGGAATLPPDPGSEVPAKPGAGILAGGSLINITIANCYFHQLGYWFNQQPMGPDSIEGVGVQCADFVGLTITNCEFTEMERACELQIVNSSSNLTIANCDFHDAIVWCVDLPHDYNGVSLNSVYICGNTFSNYCQQWANWSGYCCYPHADGIFDRGDSLNTFNDGANINVYNNTFFDSQPGAGTGDITMEGGVSLNIYNNLFTTVTSTPINPWVDGQNATMQTNFLVRIYNNTFYVGNVVGGDVYASGWPNMIWRTAASTQMDVKNNIFYDALNGNTDYLVYFNITNTAAAYAKIIFDYNCYRTGNSDGEFVWQQTDGGYPGGTNTDLGGLRGYGWETHGMVSDPLFVSLTGGTANSMANNYALQSGSPCIGAGANLSGLNLPGLDVGINGVPRPATGNWDIGAYQH
jgi:hypothetical protein